jgi:membrane fusion protein (multidrug efflux system)
MTDDVQQRGAGQTPAPVARVGRRRWWQRGALLVLGVLLLAYLMHWLHRRAVHVYEVDAQVQSHMTSLASRLPGWVTTFDLIRGDHLKKGDLVAQIDDREARQQLLALQAQEAALIEQIGQLDVQIQLSRGQRQSQVDAAQTSITATSAQLAAARATLRQTEDDYHRQEELVRQHLTSQQNRDHALRDYLTAKETVRQLEATLATRHAELSEAQALLLEPASLERQQAAMRRQLDQVRAQRVQQEINVRDLHMEAPLNGLVDETFIDQGEYVLAGQLLLMMHDPDDVWVDARVKETLTENIRVGQPATVHVDAYPGRSFQARVWRIGKAATNQFALLPDPNPSGNFTKITQRIPVRLCILHDRKLLSPGMMVEVDIDTKGAVVPPPDMPGIAQCAHWSDEHQDR